MRKEKQKISSDARAETVSQLHDLLDVESLTSLIVEKDAACALKLMTDVITRHCATLTNIFLDGTNAQSTVFEEEISKNLAIAINKCERLTALVIEHYMTAFRDGIQHFAPLISLPLLENLSMSHTFLTNYVPLLSKGLAASTTLKMLNLTHSGLIGNLPWLELGKGLSQNTSLEKLSLDNSPIWEGAISPIITSTVNNKSLTLVDWNPPKFLESESLYLDLSTLANWNNDKNVSSDIATARASLQNYQKIGSRELGTYYVSYNSACVRLKTLQDFLADRAAQHSRESLTIIIEDWACFDLEFIAAIITFHSRCLKELVLKCSVIEYQVNFKASSIELLSTALKACTFLQSLKIEGFQGHLGPYIADIIEAAAQFPSLEILGFNRTFLDFYGTQSLKKVLAQNKLIELDLTLCAMISDECFNYLAESLQTNGSLKSITFGKSPMQASWIRTMTSAIARNPHSGLQSISWLHPIAAEMNSMVEAICLDLRRPVKVKFREVDRVVIEAEWQGLSRLLERKNNRSPVESSTYRQLSAPLDTHSSNEEKEELGDVEMKEITFNSPLNQSSTHQRNYGTTSPVVSHQSVNRQLK